MATILDKLVDDDGVKFSVSLDVAPDIYIKLFLVITCSMVVGFAGIELIKNVFKK